MIKEDFKQDSHEIFLKIEKEEHLKSEEKTKKFNSWISDIMNKNSGQISNFTEIAFEKKNEEDEYGFKNIKAFNLELSKFLKKLEFHCEEYSPIEFFMEAIKKELIKKYNTYEQIRLSQQIIKTIPINDMTGVEFEKHLIEQLKNNPKFSQVKGTKGSGDGGADILFNYDGEKVVIQAKRWKNKVGNKAIQEVFSAKKLNKCNIAVVVINSSFTKQAIEESVKLGIILIDRDNLYKIENGTFLD
jgi:restriction system protein